MNKLRNHILVGSYFRFRFLPGWLSGTKCDPGLYGWYGFFWFPFWFPGFLGIGTHFGQWQYKSHNCSDKSHSVDSSGEGFFVVRSDLGPVVVL